MSRRGARQVITLQRKHDRGRDIYRGGGHPLGHHKNLRAYVHVDATPTPEGSPASPQVPSRADVEGELYDELSRLNNELVTAQRELIKRNVELERLNEIKNRFIGIAAHDLRNPLQVIGGYGELLANGMLGGVSPGQQKAISVIRKNSDYLLKLVTDLLHISNAIKFSHPKSTVEVRAVRGEREIVVDVRDEGQGIPAGEMDRLFIPFERLSVKSTGGEPSTGLGLAIARKIVEGHGGEMRVRSEVGVGSTFSFSLHLN